MNNIVKFESIESWEELGDVLYSTENYETVIPLSSIYDFNTDKDSIKDFTEEDAELSGVQVAIINLREFPLINGLISKFLDDMQKEGEIND